MSRVKPRLQISNRPLDAEGLVLDVEWGKGKNPTFAKTAKMGHPARQPGPNLRNEGCGHPERPNRSLGAGVIAGRHCAAVRFRHVKNEEGLFTRRLKRGSPGRSTTKTSREKRQKLHFCGERKNGPTALGRGSSRDLQISNQRVSAAGLVLDVEREKAKTPPLQKAQRWGTRHPGGLRRLSFAHGK